VLGAVAAKTAGGPLWLVHAGLALIVLLHVVAITIAVLRRSGESVAVKRALAVAAGIPVLQVALGFSMVMTGRPVLLRVAHEAAGVAIWMTLFLAAYLATTAAAA